MKTETKLVKYQRTSQKSKSAYEFISYTLFYHLKSKE